MSCVLQGATTSSSVSHKYRFLLEDLGLMKDSIKLILMERDKRAWTGQI